MAVQFFYDQQIRRFLLQFIRMVSNFQVQFGTTDANTGNLALQTVPVIYGDPSRQAAYILRNGSENSMQSVPAMSAYISGLKYDRDRVQEPFHVSKLHLRQRRVDPDTGLPTSEQGDAFTVERMMPVPYRLSLKLDIWTSNTEQKLQLIEQMCTLFNPSLEIQSTDNYIDWTSLSVVTLTDVNWDSRSVPVGAEEAISVATMSFELPIWISPPAKLKKLGVVQKIMSNMSAVGAGAGSVSPNSASGRSDNDYLDALDDPEKAVTRRMWNPLRYGVIYSGNTLQLLKYDDIVVDKAQKDDASIADINDPDLDVIRSGTPDSWSGFISLYGVLHPGTSEIRLMQDNGSEVIGTVAFHPADDTLLIFEPFIDTVPVNNTKPVNAIIDPFKVNVDALLIDKITDTYKVAAGTRFLTLNPINSINNTDFAKAWTVNGFPLVANRNDIIEFNGTRWFVSFDSQNIIDEAYMTNVNTGVQYRWNGEAWVRSYQGAYKEGEWTLII
jgi:hypothetical protein